MLPRVLRFDPGREGAQRGLDAVAELVEDLTGVVVDGLLGEDRLVGIALLSVSRMASVVAPPPSSSFFSSSSAMY